MIRSITLLIILLFSFSSLNAQQQEMNPEETEVWEPVPEKVTPKNFVEQLPPPDAVVLFDGSDLFNWQSLEGSEAPWELEDNAMVVTPGSGGIKTKQQFGSVQLHIEWRVPEQVQGTEQDRGNSGVFLQEKYEVQVLDSYENETYTNGMAGSIYKQHIPNVNAAREPGQWQSYDIIFNAPQFHKDGTLETPATITLLWNGILVQDHVTLEGPTQYIGHPEYESHEDKLSIMLQDHGSPVSFRNIWVRELD